MITNTLKINDRKKIFIEFRSLQLKCDMSSLSVNVGESKIAQLSFDLGVIFDQFLYLIDHITAIYVEAHIFHIIINIYHIRNLLLYYACSTIIHAFISCRLD